MLTVEIRRPQTLGPKKGQRVIAPKKQQLVNQKVLAKVRSFFIHPGLASITFQLAKPFYE